MIYPPGISDFVDEKPLQILENFASVIFNTQMKALKIDGHLCTFRTGILSSLMSHNKSITIIAGEANTTTVLLL